MKPQLKTVPKQAFSPASWRNPLWRYVNIHEHTPENFRERMAERKRLARAK